MVDQADRRARRPHKRADGEGSISLYHKGGWRARLMVGYRPDGKPDVREVYGQTQAEVRKKLADLRRQVEGGLLADRSKQETLAGYLDRWLDAVKASVRPTTHARYGQLLRLHIVPILGKKRLVSLKPDDVQRLYAGLLTKVVERGQGRKAGAGATLSPTTVRHVHVVLHTALEQAVKWGYLPRNICDVVEPPKASAKELRPPTAAEIARFLDAAQDDTWLPLWTVAVYTGARQGELLGLQWPDLDLERATLTIQRTLLETTKGGVPVYAPPKTARSRRAIALPEEAVGGLRQHRAQQLEQRLLLGPDYADYGLVFATALGTPLSHRNTLRAFRAALRRAGLSETIRFHDLRHAAATNRRAGGIDLKTVSERLGHSDIAITGNLYTHSVAQAGRDAARKLQELIRGTERRAANDR